MIETLVARWERHRRMWLPDSRWRPLEYLETVNSHQTVNVYLALRDTKTR